MPYKTKYYNRRTKKLFKSRKKNRQGKRKKGKTRKGRLKRKSASRKSRRSRVKKKIMIGGIPDPNFLNNIPAGSKVKFKYNNDNVLDNVLEGWIIQRILVDNGGIEYYICVPIRDRCDHYNVGPNDITEIIDEHNNGNFLHINDIPGSRYSTNNPTDASWWQWYDENPNETPIEPWQLNSS